MAFARDDAEVLAQLRLGARVAHLARDREGALADLFRIADAPLRECQLGLVPHEDQLRRAIAFMEDNAARPISGADIAAAHADLRTADPATTTVTAVAGRWGFLHAGRFAAAYKTAYGHPPSETLRS